MTAQVRLPCGIGGAVSVLKSNRTRLNKVLAILEKKARVRFELCVDALERGNRGQAEAYAGKLASLKKLIGVVAHHERVLEQVILRLETISEVEATSLCLRSSREACGVWLESSRVCEKLADGQEDVLRQPGCVDSMGR